MISVGKLIPANDRLCHHKQPIGVEYYYNAIILLFFLFPFILFLCFYFLEQIKNTVEREMLSCPLCRIKWHQERVSETVPKSS